MVPLFLVIVFESTSGASKAAMKSSSGTSKYFQGKGMKSTPGTCTAI